MTSDGAGDRARRWVLLAVLAPLAVLTSFLTIPPVQAISIPLPSLPPLLGGPLPLLGGSPGLSGSFPASPPAQVCGSTLLNGPAVPPAGSVRVAPGSSLAQATTDHPAGTTFWLAPGRHTLGTAPFAQVVPKDGNTYVGAPGAILDGQRLNRYAFTSTAVNVTIRYLTVENFVAPRDEGVVNHDSGSGWRMEYNTVRGNGGAGVFAGSDNVVRYNCLTSNSQYGFQAFSAAGPTNVTLDHNEISHNNTGDWERAVPGCGCTGGGKFWDVNGAVVTNNWVHHNKSVGLWADTNDIGFRFEGNYINDNDAEGIFYEISYNAVIRNNTLKRNALVKGREYASRNDTFPVAAIYLSESGGDARVSSQYTTLEIDGNLLEDNWSGVVLWENADRYCGSPNNTSSGFCTVGGAASLTTCVAGTIDNAPYRSDCRWKTQNVWVHNNDFNLDKAAIGCTPTTTSCGLQGVLSNFGTSPPWSPYKGRVVQDAITYNQNNRFTDNRYKGDWHFTAYETGTDHTPAAWQAGPYNQDARSTSDASPAPAPTLPLVGGLLGGLLAPTTTAPPATSPSTTQPGDTVAPTAPTNLTAAAAPAAVDLSWGASTDNVGVTGYEVSRDGVAIGTTGASDFRDTTVAGGRQYAYTVLAYDAASNHSPSSAPVRVTTP